MTQIIGIYIYDEVEVLDFAGPYEVFTTATRVHAKQNPEDEKLFKPILIADAVRTVHARFGFDVLAHYAITDHPSLDILLVPGGVHMAEMERSEIIDWIAKTNQTTELTASVCTGAFLLGKAGLLEDQAVTTHWEDIPDLDELLPNTIVKENVRWVESGKFISSAGISAGIDMSLHLVSRLHSEDLAIRTARHMEYDWNRG